MNNKFKKIDNLDYEKKINSEILDEEEDFFNRIDDILSKKK
jgi:hypothetical protein